MRKSVLFFDVAIKNAFGYNFGYYLQFSSWNPENDLLSAVKWAVIFSFVGLRVLGIHYLT